MKWLQLAYQRPFRDKLTQYIMSFQTILLHIYYIVAKVIIKLARNSNVEKRVLDWTLEKLKTIQDETERHIEQSVLDKLKDAAQIDSGKSHPGIPPDFDALAYLVLNPDVLHAGVDPIQHFIIYGKEEGRAYSFKRSYPVDGPSHK